MTGFIVNEKRTAVIHTASPRVSYDFSNFDKFRVSLQSCFLHVALSTECSVDLVQFIQEVKIRLNSGNASYISAQNLLCFWLLSRPLTTKMYKTIVLPVFMGVTSDRRPKGRT